METLLPKLEFDGSTRILICRSLHLHTCSSVSGAGGAGLGGGRVGRGRGVAAGRCVTRWWGRGVGGGWAPQTGSGTARRAEPSRHRSPSPLLGEREAVRCGAAGLSLTEGRARGPGGAPPGSPSSCPPMVLSRPLAPPCPPPAPPSSASGAASC